MAGYIAQAPGQSPYGWPRPNRLEHFRKLKEEPVQKTEQFGTFKGAPGSEPVRRVPINLPKYRISNGRTVSAQLQYVKKHSLAEDYFDNGDPEDEQVQMHQHKILLGMVRDADLQKEFEDGRKQQVNALMLDENGFVINGNRRLCLWRSLYESDRKKFEHLSYIDVIILPSCDSKELDRLEAELQIKRDIRSNYTWHAEATMLNKRLRRQGADGKVEGFDSAELAQIYDKTKREVDELLGMRELADNYLTSRGQKNEWSLLDDSKFAFQELNKAIQQLSGTDKEIFKEASFALIDDTSKTGRLYAAIPKIKEFLAPVKEGLFEAFPLPETTADSTAEQAFGGAKSKTGKSAAALVAAMSSDDASKEKARNVIIEVIDSQDEKAKEKNAADYLFKCIRKASEQIQNAQSHGLKPESQLKGVSEQLKTLKAGIENIEKWLAERKA